MLKQRTTFVQQPLVETEEAPDDLFTLRDQTCADCGQAFESSRRAPRCATCTSLRSGQVSPATVVCPACGVEHQIPVLASHKFCPLCWVDPVMLKMNLESNMAYAQCHVDEAWLRLDADLAHADEADRARYEAALELRQTGMLHNKTYTPAQRAAAWQKALSAADGLAPLLAGYDRWVAAAGALEAAQQAVRAVEEAMDVAR